MHNPTGTACLLAPRRRASSSQTLARAGSRRAASGRSLETLGQKLFFLTGTSHRRAPRIFKPGAQNAACALSDVHLFRQRACRPAAGGRRASAGLSRAPGTPRSRGWLLWAAGGRRAAGGARRGKVRRKGGGCEGDPGAPGAAAGVLWARAGRGQCARAWRLGVADRGARVASVPGRLSPRGRPSVVPLHAQKLPQHLGAGRDWAPCARACEGHSPRSSAMQSRAAGARGCREGEGVLWQQMSATAGGNARWLACRTLAHGAWLGGGGEGCWHYTI